MEPIKSNDRPSYTPSRRDFLKALGFSAVVGTASIGHVGMKHYLQLTLNKVLDKLRLEFKNDLVNKSSDIDENMKRLLDFLTHDDFKPPNDFLRNAKEPIKQYTFQVEENGPDCSIDEKKKKIFLNLKLLFKGIENNYNQKLIALVKVLFGACGWVSLFNNNIFQMQNPSLNKQDFELANNLFFTLITTNVAEGMNSYNFNEIQSSTENELGFNGNDTHSKLDKIINDKNIIVIDREAIKKQIIFRMQLLNIANRSNGSLTSF